MLTVVVFNTEDYTSEVLHIPNVPTMDDVWKHVYVHMFSDKELDDGSVYTIDELDAMSKSEIEDAIDTLPIAVCAIFEGEHQEVTLPDE